MRGQPLYGAAGQGGSSRFGNGTVFSIKTNGLGFTTLHVFMGTDGSSTIALRQERRGFPEMGPWTEYRGILHPGRR